LSFLNFLYECSPKTPFVLLGLFVVLSILNSLPSILYTLFSKALSTASFESKSTWANPLGLPSGVFAILISIILPQSSKTFLIPSSFVLKLRLPIKILNFSPW
jgi:hypothetical protein